MKRVSRGVSYDDQSLPTRLVVWIADRERYEANRYSKILAEFSMVVVYLEPSVTFLEENAA